MTASEAAEYLMAAIEADLPTMQWPAAKIDLVESSYKRYETRLLASHPLDDDEGLAIKLSAYRASIGY